MTDFRFNEKYLSQIPALQLLIKLGYQYISPAEIMPHRQGKLSNVVLEDILEAKLKELNHIHFKGQNYHFSEENIQSAIQKLKSVKYDGLIRTNEEIYDLLTLGTSLEQTIEGTKKSHTLHYINWQEWDKNDFHVTAEYSVERTRSVETVRPDIVLFVNGIPFTVIECKSPKIDVEEAVSQTIRNQFEDYIPKLFTYTQLVIATNKNSIKYATTGTGAKFWSVWKEEFFTDDQISELINTPLSRDEKNHLFTEEFTLARSHFDKLQAKDRQITEQDRTLYSLCRPDRLLDLTYRFTVFDAGVRKIARYQQFVAVEKVLKHIKNFDQKGTRNGGVIWHTQGSGKSLTMVIIAKSLILDPEITNPRLILVTDRDDLDKQIKRTFANCGLEPERAKSGQHLLDLVEKKQESLITTIINKFASATNIRNFKDESPNIFVLVDESHRSQSGDKGQHGTFHSKMRQVFPKGCYLGFTGTPLMEGEKKTFNQFGGLIDDYSIDQAVKDKAVVPLLYEGRHTEQEINERAINTWTKRFCKGLTEEQTNQLLKKCSTKSEILHKNEQTVFCRAFDISEHYRQNWQGTGFKGMVVAPDKRTALLYKQFIDELGHVSSEVLISPPDTREGNDDVNTPQDNTVTHFWKQMMERFGSEQKYNQQLINSFKYGEEPELLIVVNKLLTGFDAPRAAVLYLTRPLEGHTLLQAIARVNRLYSDSTGAEKEFGYIVDYAGVLEKLDKALATYRTWQDFNPEDLIGTLNNLQTEIEKLSQYHQRVLNLFDEIDNKHDEEAYEQLLADEGKREEFYERLTKFAKSLSIALSSEEFVENTPQAQIDEYNNDLKRFQNLKASVKLRYSDQVDQRDLEPKIRKLLNTHISSTEIVQITEPFNIFDEVAYKEALTNPKKSSVSKADLIASATQRTVKERIEEDPAFYEHFSELIQKTIDDFRAKRISEAEYLQQAQEIRDRVVNRQDEEIPTALANDPDGRAFYGLIQPFFADYIEDAQHLKTISVDASLAILDIIKARMIRDWETNDEVQKDMMNAIDDYLYDVVGAEYGLDFTPTEMDKIIEESLRLAKNRPTLVKS